MAEYTPIHTCGHEVTLVASAAITGGQMLEVTGSGTVGPSAAASIKVVGVAAHDAAVGQRLVVLVDAMVHETTAGGAVTAGDRLRSAPGGVVLTTTGQTGVPHPVVGLALTTAASGALVRWIPRTTVQAALP